MPLLAGALEQHGGAQLGYLAVIVPAVIIATGLSAGERALRQPAAVRSAAGA